MKINIKRAAFWLWPPYEAKIAERFIESRINSTNHWDSILKEVRISLPEDATNDNLEEMEQLARQIEKSESERLKTIEDKASSFSSGIGIVLGIMAAVTALLSDYQFDISWLVILGTLYLLTIIHLVAAAYFAARVRRMSKMAYFSVHDLLDSINNDQWQVKERIISIISRTKWNEDILLQKTNSLYVSERMFWRGVILIALLAILNAVIRTY